jgi:hypothetical protein
MTWTLVAYEGAQLRMKRSSQRWRWSYSNQLGFRQNPVEFINVGRFREVVVEPGFCKCQLVRPGAITRNCNQPGIAGFRDCPQLPRELMSIHIRQADIDHAGVWPVLRDEAQRLGGVVRPDDLIAAQLEQIGQ